MKIVLSEQLRTFLKRESRTRSSLLPSNPFYPVVVVAAAALFAPAISSPAISLWKRAIRSNRAAANRGRDLLLPRFFSLQRENARRCVRYLLGQKDSSSPVGHPSPSLSLFPSRNLEGFLEKYPSFVSFPSLRAIERRISEGRDVSSPFSIIFRLSFVPFLSSPPLHHRKLRFCAFMAARLQELQVVASRCARAPAPLIAPSPQLPPTWNATTRSLTRPTPSLSPSLIFTRDEHSCIRDSLIHHSLLLSFVYGRGRRDWLITLERN